MKVLTFLVVALLAAPALCRAEIKLGCEPLSGSSLAPIPLERTSSSKVLVRWKTDAQSVWFIGSDSPTQKQRSRGSFESSGGNFIVLSQSTAGRFVVSLFTCFPTFDSQPTWSEVDPEVIVIADPYSFFKSSYTLQVVPEDGDVREIASRVAHVIESYGAPVASTSVYSENRTAGVLVHNTQVAEVKAEVLCDEEPCFNREFRVVLLALVRESSENTAVSVKPILFSRFERQGGPWARTTDASFQSRVIGDLEKRMKEEP